MKKQRKFGRKLVLNKETIAMLDVQNTRKVFAGATIEECTLDCTLNTVCTCFSHCFPCTGKMPCDCMWPRTY